ncbi:MMPL family transporter [Peribacillus alkalitolerans]|uniref:MMPL family transporter n=1 Tax=Peribacillus alkalitolerans TaxID=1550385 RepID=UPI0013D67833|nr:MMPL family transporter [Peribacillus alkalitolerans]
MKLLSSIVVTLRKPLLALWLILAVVLSYLAIQLPTKLNGDGFEMDGDYNLVQKELSDTFDLPKSSLLILFQKEKNQSETDFKNEIDTAIQDLSDLKITESIQSPLNHAKLYKEGYAYTILSFDKSENDMSLQVEKVRDTMEKYDHTMVTGAPVIREDMNKASQDDLKRAELIGLPVAIIVLLFAFGSIVASIVPIIIGAVTVLSSFGILTLLGDSLNLSIFLLNVVPMVGLALSIDFALLFINRYREEYTGTNKFEAIRKTVMTAGRSILFSALCVFIGLAAMMVIKIDIFQTVAIGGMVVVALAVITSLTLLPALLLLLGDKLNKGMLIKPNKSGTNGWRKFAESVMKRPIIITLFAITILVIGILPVQNIRLAIPDSDSLPKEYESRKALDIIQDEFLEKDSSTVYVVAERKGSWVNSEGLKELENLVSELKKDDIVTEVESLYSYSGTKTSNELEMALKNPQIKQSLEPVMEQFINEEKLLLPVTLSKQDTSEEAKDWIRNWSKKDWDYSLTFGGSVKFNQEIFDEIFEKLPIGMAIILISTYLILMVGFRSIIIPLKAIIMNVIGLSSTFGILVWLFQEGHFGLAQTDIALVLPVFVFSLVFGLSMDYEVFLISRIHEIYLKTGNNDEATAAGLASTSKIITSAALIMIVITGAFAFTGVVPVKQIGIGIALAIFIDATIIRMLLVPALMKLLGDWNWWMPFVKKQKPEMKKASGE